MYLRVKTFTKKILPSTVGLVLANNLTVSPLRILATTNNNNSTQRDERQNEAKHRKLNLKLGLKLRVGEVVTT
jgi:hypothetical protein